MKKNIEQEKAIAQLEGPVILISCPGSGKAAVLCCSHKGKGKIIYHLCREQKRQTGIPFRQGASAQGKRTG